MIFLKTVNLAKLNPHEIYHLHGILQIPITKETYISNKDYNFDYHCKLHGISRLSTI